MKLSMLRQVDEDEFQLRKQVNEHTFVRLNSAATDAHGNFAVPQLSIKLLSQGSDAATLGVDDVLAIKSGYGKCTFDNSRSLLSVLTTIPPPPIGDPILSELFTDACLKRLSQRCFPQIGALDVTSVSAETTSVSMVLLAECGDRSALSFAKAPAEFWRALAQRAVPSAAECPPPARDWVVDLPMRIAKGRFTAPDLRALRIGDVVQFSEVSLQPDGRGTTNIADSSLEFLLHTEEPQYKLEVISICARPNQPRASLEMEHLMTNSVDDKVDVDDTNEHGLTDHFGQELQSALAPVDTSRLVNPRGVTVDVIVELAKIRLSLRELENLRIGSMIKIAFDESHLVELKIAGNHCENDQPVAIGELVQVGSSLAVQIKHVAR